MFWTVNKIHPTAVIGPDVQLGDGNAIGPYTVIFGRCVIGDGNWIGPHVAIGTPGEMKGGHHYVPWDGDESDGTIVIGNGNVIREFATVQQSASSVTRIGDNGYFMTKCHVPHDAIIGDDVTVSCSVMIGGHSIIGDRANLGLGTVIHQRLAIGSGAMVGMGSVVTRHVPPFAMAYGSPARVKGANRVGLQRAGLDDAVIDQVITSLDSGNLDQLRSVLPEGMAHFDDSVRHLDSH
jgi:UDP-N-acetylglucosamine acyltransferase